MIVLDKKDQLPVELAQFQILAGEVPSEAVLRMEGEELLTPALSHLLKMAGPAIGSPSSKVTGSLFMKRYSLYIGSFYSISFADASLPIPFSGFKMSIQGTKLFFHFPNLQLIRRTTERSKWRNEILTAIFRDHLTPLIRSIHQQSHISVKTLWSHVVFAITRYYEGWIDKTTEIAQRTRLLEDYHSLRELDAELFGLTKNPFAQTIKLFKHPALKGESIPIRSECCLNSCLPNQKACYTCPRLTAEERLCLYLGKKK